ncbi:acyloxyacyl hydrolase [Pseudooceanicola algae]|uniref:Uncharacterized protein n=1 Tax=Pseudooceanicola algae TaxID=1537215 RepID=A0A418SDG8_9RHOB|nr:acyloxyacyl hydrolase [Pseudooceanicola algae]QPM91078.1 hypothetical protein PSAL_023210 [Pseudooceanicola algae]
MDGTFAVLFLLAGAADMGINYCGDPGCVAANPAQARLAISYGDVIFQEKKIGHEVYARYDLGVQYGPFQPTVGLSVSDKGDTWVGGGAAWTGYIDQAYIQLHLMPGFHAQGRGPQIGTVLEFRSGVELGYEAHNGIRYGVSYDHRSNAELSETNPGLETMQFRISFPM